MPQTATVSMPARRSTQSSWVLKKAEYMTLLIATSTRPASASTLAWPQLPGAKSPLARYGRNAFRCGGTIGAPAASGQSVNWLATARSPAPLSARAPAAPPPPTTNAPGGGEGGGGGGVGRGRQGGHAPGQQQRRRVGVAAASVGAVRVEKVVLQVDDEQRRLGRGDLRAHWRTFALGYGRSAFGRPRCAHDALTSRLPCASTSA